MHRLGPRDPDALRITVMLNALLTMDLVEESPEDAVLAARVVVARRALALRRPISHAERAIRMVAVDYQLRTLAPTLHEPLRRADAAERAWAARWTHEAMHG